MDACRLEIGRRAARLIAAGASSHTLPDPERVVLEPTLALGDTLDRN
jgi:LacI family gluconate utilization system Gnt-I transcriptional repressor